MALQETKKYKISIFCLVLLITLVSCISLSFLNDIIPIHFNINGEPDQFASKYYILLFPCIITLLDIIMLLSIKNKSENYEKYLLIVGLIVNIMFFILLIVLVVYCLNYSDNSHPLDPSKITLPIFGVLLIIFGNIMPKVEKNNTIGIRLSWSLYNETTWRKTQRFGGFVSVITGILMLITSIIFKELINLIMLFVLLFAFIISTSIAAYHYYKIETEKES